MKKESLMALILTVVLVIVSLITFIKKYTEYKTIVETTTTPFNTIEVLGQKIRLKDNERTYNIEIKCETLTDPNTQIIYYRLNEKNKGYKVTVNNKLFNGNQLLTTDYNKITNIESNISVSDPKNKYEQIFHINATCEINENMLNQQVTQTEKKEEVKTNNGSNKSTKKTTKK